MLLHFQMLLFKVIMRTTCLHYIRSSRPTSQERLDTFLVRTVDNEQLFCFVVQ
jgi:hypothetical protein